MSFNNPANQALHKNHDVIFGISISPASTFFNLSCYFLSKLQPHMCEWTFVIPDIS